MTISDWVMIVAVILGPILAVQVQKKLESLRDKRDRKEWIFKTLMATRGTTLSPDHVQALNMIDLEFSEQKEKEKKIRDAWKSYLDHLGNMPQNSEDPDFGSLFSVWSDKIPEYLADLLHAMGVALGYNYDKVQLKRGAYTPKGHAEIEMEQRLVRKGILEIIDNEGALKVMIIPVQQSDKLKEPK